jgi:hypothetical protein
MTDTRKIESATTPLEHDHESHPTSQSLRAAAIEAAYILEAVRK